MRTLLQDRLRLIAVAIAIVVGVPAVTLAILMAAERGEAAPESTRAATWQPGQRPSVLEVGDCFDQTVTGSDSDGHRSVRSVTLRACDGPHESRVLAVFDLEWEAGTPHPGRGAIRSIAGPACRAAFEQGTGASPTADQPLGLHWIHPSRGTWRRGDRRVVCAASAR